MHSKLNQPGRLLFASATVVFATALHVPIASAQQPEKVRAALTTEIGSHRASAQSQRTIEKLDDQTQDMLLDYRATVRETSSLRRYNEQLERQLRSQFEEISAIESELTRIEETNREVLPMMLRMVETLEQFVSLDLPFLEEERGDRIAALKDIMDRADITTSEKYRRILEAYQIEMEYGRTIESYEASTMLGGSSKTVDFLRVGRVALMYQTKDYLETGVWNVDSGQWEVVNDYRDAVKKGLRIAKKQAAPDLMIMPINASKGAK